MSKKHIYIWQSGEPLHLDKKNHNPMRAINLTNFLLKKNFKVTLISSNFDHTYKVHRKKIDKYKEFSISKSFKIVLIQSPGYKNNISLSRLFDHLVLAINLRNYLSKIKYFPDLAIIGFPPIEPSIYFAFWLRKKKIPFLFDVKDLWPEYFYERVSNKILSILIRLIFYFHDLFLRKAFKMANGIIANNSYFLKFILDKIKRKKNKFDKVIYLTKPQIRTNLNFFLKKIKFKKDCFNIYFCGRINFGVFDFETILKSLKILDDKKINFHFYVGGYGNLNFLKKKINYYFLKKKITVLGFVNKFQHATMLKNSNIFIAPFKNKKNFSSNFTNKFIDAIQNNLLIVTPLKGDISKFIISNKVGLIYEEYNSSDLAQKIIRIKDNFYYLKNQLNTKNFKSMFDHENNYSNFLKLINELTKY
jgi:hypothetical protein